MNILKRLAFFLLGSIAFSPITFAAATAPTDQSGIVADQPMLDAAALTLHDGSFTGGTYDAYYGLVQVQATVQSGQIVAVKALRFPNHSGTSRSINRQALPYLLQEVVAKQSSRVDIISGATLTSRAYIASLRDALKKSSK